MHYSKKSKQKSGIYTKLYIYKISKRQNLIFFFNLLLMAVTAGVVIVLIIREKKHVFNCVIDGYTTLSERAGRYIPELHT